MMTMTMTMMMMKTSVLRWIVSHASSAYEGDDNIDGNDKDDNDDDDNDIKKTSVLR